MTIQMPATKTPTSTEVETFISAMSLRDVPGYVVRHLVKRYPTMSWAEAIAIQKAYHQKHQHEFARAYAYAS